MLRSILRSHDDILKSSAPFYHVTQFHNKNKLNVMNSNTPHDFVTIDKSKGCMLRGIFWSFLYKFIFIYYYSSYAATAFNSLWLIHMEFCMPRVASKIIFHFLLQPHFILAYRGYFLKKKHFKKNVASTRILTLGLSHPKLARYLCTTVK
jgi:hypothetical protein